MVIKRFFHKIKIILARLFEPSLPYIPEEKQYGNNGENEFFHDIQARLPNAKIKRNIVIQTLDGNAEIDCLILYKNKLFAIEIKAWKGRLVDTGDEFIKYKQDNHNDDIHIEHLKSPFKQINRSVYLLKKQIPYDAWINSIVFFEGTDHIETESANIWFKDINEITSYIVNAGKISRNNNANLFFEKCIAADYLYGKNSEYVEQCIVYSNSLCFNTSDGILTRDQIHDIFITHHWSYDELKIKTVSGNYYYTKIENGSIYVNNNGYRHRRALCNLDHIHLGNN